MDWGGEKSSEPRPFPRQDIIARFFVIIFPPLCCRLVILRKKPTRLKLLCALVVFVGLFVSLIPTIFPQVDPKAEKTKNEAHGASRVLWPIIFMLGFVSTSCLFRAQKSHKVKDGILELRKKIGKLLRNEIGSKLRCENSLSSGLECG